MNLFEVQRDLLQRVTDPRGERLAGGDSQVAGGERSAWKVLLFDDYTYNIVANFKVGDLREANITLHLHVAERKEELVGVEAVYLLAPTAEAVELFLADLRGNYFDQVHLHFAGLLDRALFGRLCAEVKAARRTAAVRTLRQFNLDFYPLAPRALTFTLPRSFMNESPAFLDALSRKVVGLLYTLSVAPLFVYERASAKLERLFERLQATLADGAVLFKAPLDALRNDKRTLVLLWESASDPSPFLVHNFQYLPLVVENFGVFKDVRNFSTLQVEGAALRLDVKNDRLWQRNALSDFPAVLEDIHADVSQWKERYDRLQLRGEAEGGGGGGDLAAFSENFNEAIESLPEMAEQRKANQNHTKISLHLVKEVERRGLEKLCVIGGEAFRDKKVSRDNLIEVYALLESPAVSAADKLRLLAVINRNTPIDLREYEKLEGLLRAHCALSEQQQRFLADMKLDKYSQEGEGGLFAKFKSVSGTLLKNLKGETFRCRVCALLTELFKRRELERLKIQSALPSSGQLNLDNVATVLVVAVDGGNVTEMAELADLQAVLKKEIVYCAAELLTGDDVIGALVERA